MNDSQHLTALLNAYQSAIHSSIAADSNFSGCSPAEIEDRLNKVKAARSAIEAFMTQLTVGVKV